MVRPSRVAHIDPSMKVRHLTLAIILALGAAAASPSRALADDCPGSDADATSQAACDDTMPAADGPADVSPGAPTMTVPAVDADGDPIPYVEETLAPPPGTILTFTSDGE